MKIFLQRKFPGLQYVCHACGMCMWLRREQRIVFGLTPGEVNFITANGPILKFAFRVIKLKAGPAYLRGFLTQNLH